MKQCVRKIGENELDRVEMYVNSGKKTMADVKKLTGCDLIINGGLFASNFKAMGKLVAGGKTYTTENGFYGYGFRGNRALFSYDNNQSCSDFISAYPVLVRDSKATNAPVPIGLTGDRARSAIGVTAKNELVLFCCEDVAGTRDYTLEELSAYMIKQNCVTAINLDGGGSSQCDFSGDRITSSRIVHNYILVFLKKEKKKKKVAIDAGHDAENKVNASADKSYYEHEFNLDIAKRMEKLLSPYMDVYLTRANGSPVGLSERCRRANNSLSDLFVSIHSNSAVSTARGYENFILSRGGNAEKLAKKLHEQAIPYLHSIDRGVKVGNYQVLRETNMPAVLIEHAFHSNADDLKLLKDDGYRWKCAKANARGILSHLGMGDILVSEGSDPSEVHWAEKHYKNLKLTGAKWLEYDKPLSKSDVTLGELLALVDKSRGI